MLFRLVLTARPHFCSTRQTGDLVNNEWYGKVDRNIIAGMVPMANVGVLPSCSIRVHGIPHPRIAPKKANIIPCSSAGDGKKHFRSCLCGLQKRTRNSFVRVHLDCCCTSLRADTLRSTSKASLGPVVAWPTQSRSRERSGLLMNVTGSYIPNIWPWGR